MTIYRPATLPPIREVTFTTNGTEWHYCGPELACVVGATEVCPACHARAHVLYRAGCTSCDNRPPRPT